MLQRVRNIVRLVEHILSACSRIREKMVRPLEGHVTPNFLSILRICLALAILAMLSVTAIKALPFRGVIIASFIIAVITDTVDGTLARITNNVTQKGAFLDRLGDKLLVCGIVGALLWGHNWKVAALVIGSEVVSISFAIFGMTLRVPVDSEWLAKGKMVSQSTGIVILFFIPQGVDLAIGAFIFSLGFGAASLWEQTKRAYGWLKSKNGAE